ncbi:unnamed protein product [Gongylonema pulchrum]|uniref:Phospholipase B-like n=1 Tax=Gongylonema pulchrum TaxID=637853 RepID=A0A183F1R0_9BILA|nr:unnamed protein product [Gongylonema pulchrum]
MVGILGILTRQLINYHFRNTLEGMCDGESDYCKKLYNYLSENLDWISRTVNKKTDADSYWKQILVGILGILTRQLISYHFRNTLEGMCDGERDYCKKLYNYLSENLDWISRTVNKKTDADSYWKQVSRISFITFHFFWKNH